MNIGYERKVSKYLINWGYTFNGIRLGFQLDKYGFSIDLLVIYFGVNWR